VRRLLACGQQAPHGCLGVARLVAGQAAQIGERLRGDAEQALASGAALHGGDLAELLAEFSDCGLGGHGRIIPAALHLQSARREPGHDGPAALHSQRTG
jgi:hypothetical protein